MTAKPFSRARRQLRSIEQRPGPAGIPRALVLSLSVVALSLPAAATWAWNSTDYRVDEQGRVAHFHTAKLTASYQKSFTGSWVKRANEAIAAWDANRAIDIAHVKTGGNLVFARRNRGDNGIRVAWTHGYHEDQSTIEVNSFYSMGAAEQRGRLCKAIGGELGLQDRQSQDCMGPDPATNSYPDATSQGLIEAFFGPNLEFSGSLWDNRARLHSGQAYDLTAAMWGHTVARIVARLDGNVILDHSEPRTQCDDLDKDVCVISQTTSLGSLSQGVHTIDATATNTEGFSTSRSFKLYVDYPRIGFNELRWSTNSFNGGWQPDENDIPLGQAVDAHAAVGADASRLIVVWQDVIENPDGWDRYTDAYHAMIGDGIRPVVELLGAPPQWAGGCTVGAPPPTPAHYPDWQAFVRQAAETFNQARALEIWNEPNSRDFWGGCAPEPLRYLRLVELAKQAVAASANPSMTLVSAGLNPAASPPSHIGWEDYLAVLADPSTVDPTVTSGIGDYVDAIGLHPFPLLSECTGVPGSLGRSAADQVSRARAIAPSDPVWVTEVGVSSAPRPGNTCLAREEDGQALAIASIYTKLQAQEVPVVIFHQLVDEPLESVELYRHYGLTRASPFLEPKQSYWCLARERGYPAPSSGIACPV